MGEAQVRRGVTPEVRLAGAALRTCAALLVPAAAIGLLVGGQEGAFGAAAGVAIVGALSAASLPLYRWGATRGVATVLRLAVVGIVLRLVLAAVLLAIASQVPALSTTAVAVGMGSALLATHIAEITVAARDPRLYWVDPHAKKAAT